MSENISKPRNKRKLNDLVLYKRVETKMRTLWKLVFFFFLQIKTFFIVFYVFILAKQG